MSIRQLALAAAVIIGGLGFTSRSDAQVLYSSGYYTAPVSYTYTVPTYITPTYTYSSGYLTSYTGAYWGWYPSTTYSYPYYSGYYTSYPAYYYGRRGRLWRW